MLFLESVSPPPEGMDVGEGRGTGGSNDDEDGKDSRDMENVVDLPNA